MNEHDDLHDVARELGVAYQTKGLRISVAESLTAGLIAASIAEIPGSSAWLERGWVVYCNDAKIALGVNEFTLNEFGAVSHQCAEELAKAALSQSNADIAISATGFAGPGGDDVGLFFLGCAFHGGVFSKKFHVEGDRNSIRRKAALAAMKTLIETAKAEFDKNPSKCGSKLDF